MNFLRALSSLLGTPGLQPRLSQPAKRMGAGSPRLQPWVSPGICLLLASLILALPAHAHVNSKDVFEQITAGPYKLFVTVRPPSIIPGVATVEVRSYGAPISSLTDTPMLLTGEASHHPPTPDAMKQSASDPNFFTGQLWIMESGSWQVRFGITGAQGQQTAAVPVPAVSTQVLKMQRPMGLLLAALGLILALGVAGIVFGAVRESRLRPGIAPDSNRRRRALISAAVALVLVAFAVYWGNKWWNVEAADYSDSLYTPWDLHPILTGNQLQLLIGSYDKDDKEWEVAHKMSPLLPDHGHLMHLYAIRWPEMDVAYHLHPTQTAPGRLTDTLPAMPPGEYHLYADIVHTSGFPETLTATLTIPASMHGTALDSEDAFATPAPLSAGMLGLRFTLPDGYTMVWDRPATLAAGTATLFRFTLLDPQGKPARDMQPYLGMAGHAAFVKTDGTVFAHTHPEGSAAMPAMMLANAASGHEAMSDMVAGNQPGMTGTSPEPLSSTVEFPYGFPTSGRYRIFIQMKHNNTVETGVFDAQVQ